MPSYKMDKDGSVVFPENMPPPPDIYKHTRDSQNPRRFTPDFDPCIHRFVEVKILSCGREFCVWACKLGKPVSFSSCGSCGDRKCP